MKNRITLVILSILFTFCVNAKSKNHKPFRVVGYYCGVGIPIDSFEVEKLTHLIFSFGHLNGNKFAIHSKIDSTTIQRMVELKSRNPNLKVMLSLGGWSGCKTCSDVFNTEIGRKEFAQSLKTVSQYFKTDGIDLDWEYPAIKGFPGHTFRNEDKHNFTLLLKEIRNSMGQNFEISFAAGGFTSYIDSSIEWKEVNKYVDFINVMSYDLIHGYSTTTGHHTALFSTTQQTESTDHAVKMMLQHGIPSNKIVIGAAFYGRYFQIISTANNGLYQKCSFLKSVSYKLFEDSIYNTNKGFEIFWDSVAKAPYAINRNRNLFFTYDNEKSIQVKVNYGLENSLGGIMFWQLYDDKLKNGLLNCINAKLENSKNIK
jgi:chitinase